MGKKFLMSFFCIHGYGRFYAYLYCFKDHSGLSFRHAFHLVLNNLAAREGDFFKPFFNNSVYNFFYILFLILWSKFNLNKICIRDEASQLYCEKLEKTMFI